LLPPEIEILQYSLPAAVPVTVLPRVVSVLHRSSGAFAKLQSASISFIMSVRPSICVEQLGSDWTDFCEILYLNIIRKFVEKFPVSLQRDHNNGTCHEDQHTL
jgi:hypothetical protein